MESCENVPQAPGDPLAMLTGASRRQIIPVEAGMEEGQR
jgi:hypothetical protein